MNFHFLPERQTFIKLFAQSCYTNCLFHHISSECLDLHKYGSVQITTDNPVLDSFCFFVCCLLILMNLWVVSGGMNHGEVGIQ